MSAFIEILFMIVSLVLIGIIFFSVYTFRRQPGIPYLLGLIVCRFIYVCGVILESSVYTLAEKLFFRNFHQTALNMMVPFFVLFVWEWVAPHRALSLRWKIGIFTGFALWSSQMWLDAKFQWIYRSIELIDGYLVTTRTAYSLSFTVFCLVVLVTCLFVLIQYLKNIRSDLRKAGMWVLVLASFLLVIEVMKFAAPEWSPWLMPLTVYCSFFGLTTLIIILRSRLFALVPIARSLVLDTLQEGIMVANATGKIIDNNQQFARWCAHLGHATVADRRIRELLTPWPAWLSLCERMEQGHVEIEVQMDGEKKSYRVNVYPLYTLQERQQGSISLLVDLTEKQKDLEQIAKLNEMKDQLIALVSHDIRGPLALQYQLIALLEDDLDKFPPAYREVIAQLGGQIRNTLGVTTNVLEWFRSRREDMTFHIAAHDLAEIVTECIQALQTYSSAKSIQVTSAITPGMTAHVDREVLGLILRNLLSNGIKFTPTGGCVHIEAEADASRETITLSVRDTGVGLSPERISRLLADERLSPQAGTGGEQGAGLGLLVTRQFIANAGGAFSIQSCLGEGTTIQFTIKGGAAHESDVGG